MRILVDYRPALRARTGVGEYVHELVRALVQSRTADESLTLWSASWKDRLDSSAVPGARVIDRRIPVRLLNATWHRLNWPPVERLAHESFDVVHSAHPLLMPTRSAAQIVTIHDLDFLDHPERTRAEIRRDYPALAAAHAARADRILVSSSHAAADVQRRLDVSADRITIASPGAPAWPRRVVEPAAGCILFLGTLEPRKNLDVLLEAYGRLFARRPDAPPLVLAGRVSESARALVDRALAAPFAGHVEVPGYVDDAERQELFRRALVFVLPSHTEGFGMPALEAMTCGVPVVVSNRGALPEVVGDAGVLIDPDDAGALAHAIAGLLTDRAERDRRREIGWQRAATFRWQTTADRVRDAWALALAARRRRG